VPSSPQRETVAGRAQATERRRVAAGEDGFGVVRAVERTGARADRFEDVRRELPSHQK
jgi:hypothetical protein